LTGHSPTRPFHSVLMCKLHVVALLALLTPVATLPVKRRDNSIGRNGSSAGKVSEMPAAHQALQPARGQGPCDPKTEVAHEEHCYYLDGSGGKCDPGYELAPQRILHVIGQEFEGKTYKHTVSINCCISHKDEAKQGQNYGMASSCDKQGVFHADDVGFGARGCGGSLSLASQQLTFCVSINVRPEANKTTKVATGKAMADVKLGVRNKARPLVMPDPCDARKEVFHEGRCYYLDGSGGRCDDDYALAPQQVLHTIGGRFAGKTYKHQVSNNCCIAHSAEAQEGQDFGMVQSCDKNDTFLEHDVAFGGKGCIDAAHTYAHQLTLCASKQTHEHEKAVQTKQCPSMFVAVFSKLENRARRAAIREMWNSAGEGWSGNFKAKFAICTRGRVPDVLRLEASAHQDLLIMDCKEGYHNGTLTQKVSTTMRAYLKNYSSYALFMKTDDDTWVSTSRLCNRLQWRRANGKSNLKAYMGVFAEGKENMKTKHAVIRDPHNSWYEPESKFRENVFPLSAKGGPGYILPRKLVNAIITSGIADQNELNNEDKAVGVWVQKLVARGFAVEYVNLPGTDGFVQRASWVPSKGKFKDYPFFFHHHLSGDAIACLHRIDKSRNPDMYIGECFPAPATTGKKLVYEATGLRIHAP